MAYSPEQAVYRAADIGGSRWVVPASTLSRLDLTTGAFPATYGDRMGGILDLSTVTPTQPRHVERADGTARRIGK